MTRFLSAVILGVFVLAAPTLAQEPEPGYTSLFNGKDLTGWVQKGKDKEDLSGKTVTPNKKFSVEDGAIKVKGGGGGDLYTKQNFNGEFHLKLEFRAAPKADSGVYIRGQQLQVRDYPTVGPYNKVKFNKGGWNELDITVTSGVVTTSINGKTLSAKDVLELTVRDGKPAAKLNGKDIDVSKISVDVGAAALCKCNGDVIEKAFKIGATGGIGLQTESGDFEFRHIRIKTAATDKPRGEAPRTPGVDPAGFQGGDKKKRLLLITESRGFVHGVVNRGKNPLCLVEKTFLALAEKEKFFEVDYTQDSRSVINDENLKKYDAVFFYTTGELPLSDAQKSDLLAFIRSGKGFGGSHCATDTFYKWKEYGELIGGYFDGHPWHQDVRVIVEDQKHLATKHLGESFMIKDEIYQFKAPYGRDKVHVLMKLDMESVKNQGKRADKDNALSWVHNYGKGRVFYTALGHRDEVWNDPRFQQHVVGGLKYMFGMEK